MRENGDRLQKATVERAELMALFFKTLQLNGVPESAAEYLTSHEFQAKAWRVDPMIHIHVEGADPAKVADAVADVFARQELFSGGQ